MKKTTLVLARPWPAALVPASPHLSFFAFDVSDRGSGVYRALVVQYYCNRVGIIVGGGRTMIGSFTKALK